MLGKGHKFKVTRRQYPLSQADGMTIHKSQGLTLKHANMNFVTSRAVGGLHYTGISRVETIANVIFQTNSLCFDKVKSNVEVEEYMDFLRNTRPVKLLSTVLTQIHNNQNLKIVFHNIQTWTAQKTPLILQHPSTKYAELLILLETHCMQTLPRDSDFEYLQYVNRYSLDNTLTNGNVGISVLKRKSSTTLQRVLAFYQPLNTHIGIPEMVFLEIESLTYNGPIVAIYRSAQHVSSAQFNNCLHAIFSFYKHNTLPTTNAANKQGVILFGDFNIDVLNPTTPSFQLFHRVLNKFGYLQLIQEPTRYDRNYKSTALDVVICPQDMCTMCTENSTNLICSTHVSISDYSDHYPITINIGSDRVTSFKPNIYTTTQTYLQQQCKKRKNTFWDKSISKRSKNSSQSIFQDQMMQQNQQASIAILSNTPNTETTQEKNAQTNLNKEDKSAKHQKSARQKVNQNIRDVVTCFEDLSETRSTMIFVQKYFDIILEYFSGNFDHFLQLSKILGETKHNISVFTVPVEKTTLISVRSFRSWLSTGMITDECLAAYQNSLLKLGP